MMIPLLAAACVPLSGDWIRAADMARAIPIFEALAPETRLGRAPMAGARRVFAREELLRLARHYRLPATGFRPVCFSWNEAPPEPVKLAASMAQSLGCDASGVDVVEYSRHPIPVGTLVFAKENVRPVSGESGVFLWKGLVRYAENRTTPVWAKVRITGVEIQSGTRPPDVKAGDIVQLAIRRGPLTITTEGRAERSGHIGEKIPLTNLASGAKLHARIEEKGRLSVTVP